MGKLKTASTIALSVALGLNVAAAADASNTKNPVQSDSTVAHSQKVLRVGCDAAFAPFTYTDDKGKLIGFDVDLIHAIGKAMGYEIDMRGYPFDGIIPTLITDNIDLIISGFTISEERAKRVDFTNPYYRSSLTILSKKSAGNKYDSVDKLKNAEICVQIGTTGALYLEQALTKPHLKQFNSPPESYLEFQNGGCDVVVNDRPVNDFFLAQNPKNSKDIVSHEITSAQNEYYGIAVKKGNTELLKILNEGLKKVMANGEFAKISTKWFGHDISENLASITAEQAAKGREN